MKKVVMLISAGFLALSLCVIDVDANGSNKFQALEEYEEIIYVDNGKSDEDLLKEMEKLENNKIFKESKSGRSSTGYTVQLEFYRNEYKNTGLKVAANQPQAGTNFGVTGGAFGYSDGNGSSPVTMSFGVAGYGISASVGVGNKARAGVNGYSINAPANKYVKLYVDKTVKAITYKRYKVYNINGYREAYGYTTSLPMTYKLAFTVK